MATLPLPYTGHPYSLPVFRCEDCGYWLYNEERSINN